jgi:AcrR family transcriptional regulator
MVAFTTQERGDGQTQPAAAERIRSGPHGLPREQVGEVQRMRLLQAMAETAADEGLHAASVGRVIAYAGVSRRTFYELFEDREECFLAVFDEAIGRAMERVQAAAEAAGSRWVERTRAGLLALLGALDEEPQLARVCVVWTMGASPAVLARRAQVLRTLAEAVDRGRGSAGRRELAPLTAEGVVGAVFSIVHARLLEPRPEPLQPLLGELMGLIVLPYLGPQAVAKERSRPAPRASRPVANHGAKQDPLRGLAIRVTYRTLLALEAVGAHSGGSNREIGRHAGMSDQGQVSKLLARLERVGLIENRDATSDKGLPNAWWLTRRGKEVEQTIEGRLGSD